MLTKEEKDIIKSTVPILEQNGTALTSYFYNRMLTNNPQLKNIFNQGNQKTGRQQQALAMMVLAYAQNIDHPEVLISALEKAVEKHTSLGVTADQYAIVGENLLSSIREVLDLPESSPVLQAWGRAYGELAEIFIKLEKDAYGKKQGKEGGWAGWRSFIVNKKVQESSEIASLYLVPEDGGKLSDFVPGQYISVRVFVKELNVLQPRQYSLTCAPNGSYYRIAVKREAGSSQCDPGVVSNLLHLDVKEGDKVEVSAPSGTDLAFDVKKNNPVVLLSGGVGQTPFISILESLVKSQSSRQVVWVHGARNKEVDGFKEETDRLLKQLPNAKKFNFYNTLSEREVPSGVFQGIVEISAIKKDAVVPGAEYYICGPAQFIKKQFNDLVSNGVHADAIHYEEFGPSVLNLAEEKDSRAAAGK